jgi:hypothetical protein
MITKEGFAEFATQFLLFQAFPNAMRFLFAKIGVGECYWRYFDTYFNRTAYVICNSRVRSLVSDSRQAK